MNEPSIEQTIQILHGVKDKYKEYHHVEFTDGAIITAVELANKYIKNRHLPDKAIDAIDEAAAMVKVSHIHNSMVGTLYEAAKIKNPSLGELWKRIQEIDKKIVDTLVSSKHKHNQLVRERELLEKQLGQFGITTVDVDDVKKVIADWIDEGKLV